ncbi:MAG: methyltransferase domain-containing protein [Sedimentisphaerales bacterium]
MLNLLEYLRQPQSKKIGNLDDPQATVLHSQIIKEKVFLKNLYTDFYKIFRKSIAPDSCKMIELGSGGGFIKEVIPNAITSDIMNVPNIDMVFSAEQMPFENNSVDAFFMIDVLHHIKKPKVFLAEAQRCLKSGGKMIMIEPANTVWYRLIIKNFHHEVFDTLAEWEMNKTGRLSDANGALAWIIFQRDREIFESEFKSLRVKSINFHTPFKYILSGGLTYRQFVPSFMYGFVKFLEICLSPFNKWIGMFETIVLEKQ